MKRVQFPEHLKPCGLEMLQELEEQSLDVILIPSPCRSDWDTYSCIRAVQCRNPSWYRELCMMFPRYRRKRKEKYTESYVKRGRVLYTLRKMLEEGSTSSLAEVLLAFAEERYNSTEVPF